MQYGGIVVLIQQRRSKGTQKKMEDSPTNCWHGHIEYKINLGELGSCILAVPMAIWHIHVTVKGHFVVLFNNHISCILYVGQYDTLISLGLRYILSVSCDFQ